jgi:polyhydroxybutyrate depolymerase
MGLKSLAFATGALGLFAGSAWAGCGDQPDACETSGGIYHIEMPAPEQGFEGHAVMFLHGYGGSGAGALKNRGMVEALKGRGYAVIAPTAERRNGGNRSWVFYPGWSGRDDAAFLADVRGDVADRFAVDPERVLLAGFSAGGFMVNYLACADPGAFPAYAPVSGGFWRPMPDSCAGPVKMFHTHGWSDGVVPLEGRILGGGRFEQGDIFAGFEIWREANECPQHAPDKTFRSDGFQHRVWEDCAPGSHLQFALFPGGHRVPAGWADMAVDWFEAQLD